MISLLIADDHEVLRLAFCEMLEKGNDYKVLAQVSNGEELLGLLEKHNPDMIIMDIQMPKLDGIQTLQKMQEKGVHKPVLVLSADDGKKNVRNVLKAGAKGFIPKNAGIEELLFAIDSILKGNTYLSPSIAAHLMGTDNDWDGLDNTISALTPREREVFVHLANGLSHRTIAKMLHISSRTVDTHRTNILKKLNLNANADIVKLAISKGLISV